MPLRIVAQRELSASEALYAFMAWLTSRKEPVVFSAEHDTAGTAESLIKEFCEANNLAEPHPGWHCLIVYPSTSVGPVPEGDKDNDQK